MHAIRAVEPKPSSPSDGKRSLSTADSAALHIAVRLPFWTVMSRRRSGF
ncbi:hypothetical protein [Arthrobacter sp.]